MLCVIAEATSESNKKELEQQDASGTEIHLFEHSLSGGINLGKTLALLDELQSEKEETEAVAFYTDMEELYRYVSRFLQDFFSDILLAADHTGGYRKTEYDVLLSDDVACGRLAAAIKGTNRLKRFIKEYHAAALDMNEEQQRKYPIAAAALFQRVYRDLQPYADGVSAAYDCFLEEYAEIFHDEERDFRLFALSVLLQIKRKRVYVEKLCIEVLNSDMSFDSMFFLYQQLARFYFENGDIPYTPYVDKLYNTVFEIYKQACTELLKPMPKDERNKDRVVVIARQFTGFGHAPTRSALERIRTLTDMGRDVLCFHSREFLTDKGRIPFYQCEGGNLNEALNGMHFLETEEGCQFHLYQPPCGMPDFNEIQKILATIREQKPYEIIVIGNNCLLGDLCAEMIPVICIHIVFSALPIKKNQFVAVGRPLTEEDYRKIEKSGGQRERYIESTFTFEMAEQKTTLHRDELGLPSDRFILSVVGTRLDMEVTGDFLNALTPVLMKGCHIVFAGYLYSYEKLCAEYPFLQEHSTFVGYQEDILAFEELCDLYVNPPRIGGGYSAVEAFYKHKPGVTMSYGDVSAVMGKEFWVNSLEEMAEKIIYYKEHTDYYAEMAEKAYQRSLELFDGKAAMKHILEEAESREGFF